MDIWSQDKLVLFTLFALPGFISLKIYDIKTSGYLRDTSKQLIDTVVYSCLNLAICSWFIYMMETVWKAKVSVAAYLCFYFVIFFIVPVFSGLILFWLRKLNLIQNLLPHPLHRSWDYVFSQLEQRHVKVVLKNGQTVLGLYGANSFTSTDPNHYEIYIEEVWNADENENFQGRKFRSKGLLISRSEISYIEFFELPPREPSEGGCDESKQKADRKLRRKRV